MSDRSRTSQTFAAMPVDRRRPKMWTPRSTTTRHPKRITPQKARPIPEAKEPMLSKRTITSLEDDPASVAMLEGRISEWCGEGGVDPSASGLF